MLPMRAAAMGICLVLHTAACTSDAGLARIRFELEAPAELAAPARLVFAIAGPPDDEGGRAAVSSTTLELPAGPLVSMAAPAIELSYGAGQVATMEVRDLAGEALFYGVSAPFTLEPDVAVDVLVPVRARPTLSLAIEGARDGRVTSPSVGLRVRTDRGAQLVLAPTPPTVALDARLPRALLAGGTAAGERVEWDLDTGLPRGCVAQDACPRTVFARVYDDRGYASALAQVDVEVDTRAPEVVEGSATLRIGASELAPSPTAASPGAAVAVSFLASELLARAELLAGGLTFAPCQATSLLYTCTTLVPREDVRSGRVVVRARLEDRAGNTAVYEVLDLDLDADRPAPPDAARLVLERRPWGNGSAAQGARLIGEAGAVETGAQVVVLGALGTPITTSTPADAAGRFGVELPGDAVTVSVRVLDPAGQPSEGVEVTRRRVVVPFGALDAPVRAERVAQLGHPREGGSGTPVLARERALLGADDGDRALTATAGVQWVDRPRRALIPPARSDHGLVFDRGRGVWVLFGGSAGPAGERGDLWEYDGVTWRERVNPPASSCSVASRGPEARRQHGMVYDAARRVTVVHGGFGASGALGDTWAWDGTSWSELCPAHTPPGRAFVTMAYDRARGEVVLLGAEAGEVWLWDGVDWRGPVALPAAGMRPAAREAASLAWDPSGARLLLVGGRSNTGAVDDGLWAWSAGAWTLVAPPAVGGPPPRALAAWAHVPASDGMLLLGGSDPGGAFFDDAWLWDGAQWTEVQGPPEPPRHSAVLAEADPAGRVLYSGGRVDAADRTVSDALWALDPQSAAWRSGAVEEAWPPARARAASAWDPVGARWLVFGGDTGVSPSRSDTWSWDGAAWARTASTGPALVSSAMAWDAATGTMLLVGSPSDRRQTTAWALDGQRWRAAGIANDRLDGPTAAYRRADVGVVMSGTGQAGDLRALVWQSGTLSAWPAAGGPTAPRSTWSSDAVGDVLLAFGGRPGLTTASDALWIHRGSWRPWSPVGPAPGPRYQHQAAFDALHGELLVAGGTQTGPTVDAALWAFDPIAERWRVWPAGVAHTGASMVVVGETAWSFGGTSANGTFSSGLRRLDRPVDARPALRLALSWSALGVARGRIDGVRVVLRGRGTDGVEVRAWDAYEGAWASGAEASAAAGEAVTLSAALAPERVLDGAGELALVVQPRGRAGAGWRTTAVSLDHLEVVITYGGP